MAYNGFLGGLLFNTGVVAAWCVFLWRVLDGPRFRGGGTVLAHARDRRRLPAAGAAARRRRAARCACCYPTGGAGAGVFCSLRRAPGRKLLAVAAGLIGAGGDAVFRRRHTGGGLSDGRAVCRLGQTRTRCSTARCSLFLLLLLVVSLPFLRARNNLSGRQLLVSPPFRSRRSSAPPPFRRSSSIRRGMSTRRCCWS